MQIKSIPNNILRCIFYFSSYETVIDSEDNENYGSINKYIMETTSSKLIKKKFFVKELFFNNEWVSNRCIPLGRYYEKRNGSIFVYYHYRMNMDNRMVYRLEINVFGKNAGKSFEHIKDITMGDYKNKIELKNGYIKLTALGREMDTVFIEDKHKVTDLIDNWLMSKNMYANVGRMYKLGILLYGVPGTGKTSLIKAIATKYNRRMTVITKRLLDDNSLFEIGRHISPGDIIIMEELDLLCGKDRKDNKDKSKEDEKKSADDINTTMYKLLNLLDGLSSTEDVIILATTNHIETLDDAMIRNGRFDLKFEVHPMSDNMKKDMCKHFEVDYNRLSHVDNMDIQKEIIDLKLKDKFSVEYKQKEILQILETK